TQVEIDQALFNLIAAKEALNGQTTDFTAISKEISEYTTIQSTAKYYNADSTSQISYDTAIRVAQLTLSKHNVTQVEIDQALFNLIAAKEALNGQTTDFTALESEVNAYNSVKNSFVYFNAETEKQKAYDSTVQSAQLVLYQENLTQAVVNQILTNLLTIKADLNGQKTDISALRNAVAVSSLLKTTDVKYINASENVKQAYDQALAKAKAVLTDENVSQVSVDQVLAELQAAQVALDGVASPTSENKPSENAESSIKPDEKSTPPPAEPILPSEVEEGATTPSPVAPSLPSEVKEGATTSSSVDPILPPEVKEGTTTPSSVDPILPSEAKQGKPEPESEERKAVVENTNSIKVDTVANVSPIQSPTLSHQLSSDKNQGLSFAVVAPANHPEHQPAIRQDTEPTQKAVASADRQLPNTSSKDESAYLFLGIALVTTVFITQKKKDESV
ncbi:TPA: LPXTG cell wall anchor domain-containing protein, partial [Streptococcus suis]